MKFNGKEHTMRSLRHLTFGLLALALFSSGAIADDGHKDWINLLSVSQSITRPMGSGASQTPGARLRVETKDFLPRVEAGRDSGSGTVVLAVEARSKAHRALSRSSYALLTFETPKGKRFSLEGVRIGKRSSGATAAGGEVPVESFSLNYEKIHWTY